MSDKIKASDLFEEGFATEAKAEIDAFKKSIQDTIPLIAKFKEKQKSIQDNPLDNSSNIRQHKKDIADSIKLENDYAAAKAKSAKILSDAAKKQLQDEKFLNKEIANAAKEEAKRAKAIKDSQSAYQKLSKELINNKKAVKDLLASGKELSASDKLLVKDTQELDKHLKEIDSQVGDNQRNVGGYKEALNDAAAELGAFGGGLSRIIRTLKILQKENSETTSGTQKLGNALKIIGAALVLALVAATVKAVEKMEELTEKMGNLAETTGLVKDAILLSGELFGGKTVDAMIKYATELHNSRGALRALDLQLQRVNIDLEEQNQIAGDTTIGFDERNKALKESLELSKKASDINILTSQIELKNINNYVAAIQSAGKGVNHDILEKQIEAQKKLNEATAQGSLLELQNAEKVRQMNIAKAEEEIKLLVSKKESAHEQAAILETQLKDERKQLEERKKIADELLGVQKKATDEEIKLFKKDIGIKFNANELLKEQDDIILANKIKNLKTLEGKGLGADAIALLAKIIKTSQENEIANAKIIADQQNEEIKRQQKLYQIHSDIATIENQQQLVDLKLQQLRDTTKIEKQRNFNIKKLDIEKEYLLKEADLKQDELRRKEQADEVIANNTINDTQELNAEIEKLQAKLQLDLSALDEDTLSKAKSIADQKKEILRKQLEDELNTTIDFAEQSAKRKDEIQEKQLNNDLDMRQRNIEQQQQLAINGRSNTLVFEQAAAAKDELEKQKLAEKEKKREKAIAFLKLFAAYADKGEPDQALAKTLVQMAIAGAIAGSYFEGTENVGEDLKGNKMHSGKDGYHIAVDGSERILTGDQNKMIGNMTNDELASLARNYHDGYLPKYITEGNTGTFAENLTNSLLLQQVTTLNKEISEIKNTLKNRPSTTFNIHPDGTVSKEELRNGLKKVHVQNRPPLNYF